MSQTSRVFDYLRTVSPRGATNSEIAKALEIEQPQAVFKITQDLRRKDRIRGERAGSAWTFYALAEADADEAVLAAEAPESAPSAMRPVTAPTVNPATRFETLARRVMSVHHGALLGPATVPGVPKQFDFVSGDQTIVGDAKYFTLVNGSGTPPAKLSNISEDVWLLEKTGAPHQFLVFGNDRAVPAMWLKKYGDLVSTVSFYFLADDGTLELLQPGSVLSAIRAPG